MSGYQVMTLTIIINPGVAGGAAMACPATKRAISGGARTTVINGLTSIVASYPQNATVWNTQVYNMDSIAQSYTFYAVCVNVAP
jgi:hypothetical protein